MPPKNLKVEDDEQGDLKRNKSKRRCVSTACIACRKRKSKCDGNTPSCAACSSVYGTECIYDPNSDHRRKTSYKKDADSLKTKTSTLQILMQAILTYPEEAVYQLVQDIRSCENFDELAGDIVKERKNNVKEEEIEDEDDDENIWDDSGADFPNLETDMSGKMGSLRLEGGGQVQFVGATSILNLLPSPGTSVTNPIDSISGEDAITSWTTVTKDRGLLVHLINMYFTWHYPYFTVLSKSLFFRDFLAGCPSTNSQPRTYCSALLVNAMLALGCHFTTVTGSRTDPNDAATAGNHFFNEAKRSIHENDEHETPRLATTQAFGLMSVREAGCGREARGWIYSGMSFRMACDLGLHLNPETLAKRSGMSDEEIDARKVTFWGCFLFDKCWSNYMGRMPQLPLSATTVPKYDVFPDEDSESWTPYTDNGMMSELTQAARTRAVSLQISALCEISNDILLGFYVPTNGGATNEPRLKKDKASEMKRLVALNGRLEEWAKNLPAELEAKEGALPSVLLMHMFHQLFYLLLFRPFLKLSPGTKFPAHLAPRKMCTNAATTISKYLRLYKRTYGLKQICNIAVYIVLSACTVHLINLPSKAAKRDIVQGVKSLEEISEYWLCAKRALIIIQLMARRYNLELSEEAEEVLSRMNSKGEMFGFTAQDIQASPQIKTDTINPSLNEIPPTPQVEASMLQFEQQSPGFFEQAHTNNLFTPYFDPGSSPSASFPSSVNPSNLPSPQHNFVQLPPPPQPLPPLSQQQQQPQQQDQSQGFTGFDTLIDQSQQWWLKDQVQLATDLGEWQYSPPSMGSDASDATYVPYQATTSDNYENIMSTTWN